MISKMEYSKALLDLIPGEIRTDSSLTRGEGDFPRLDLLIIFSFDIEVKYLHLFWIIVEERGNSIMGPHSCEINL